MFDQIRQGKLTAIYSSDRRRLLGFAPSELERHSLPAFEKWLLMKQPARPREAPREDLVEVVDALPELTDRCERLRAVAGRENRKSRLLLAEEWGMSEDTVSRHVAAALKGPAALKRRQRADKGTARGPGDLIRKYGKEAVLQGLELIDTFIRVQLMDGRALSLSRRLKDARKECLRLNIDPLLINYARVRRINESIGKGTLAFHGPQKQVYKNGYQPHCLVAKPDRIRQYGSIDHYQFDLIIHNPLKRDRKNRVVGGPDRPWLTAIRDECSNRFLGYHISFEHNSQTIAYTVYDACSKYTPLENVKHDLGNDMIGAATKAVFQQAGTQMIDCEGEHGQAKGVERSFGDVAADFCRQFKTTWCGSCVENKPDQIKPEDMTLEDLKPQFAEWLRENVSTGVNGSQFFR